MKKAVIDPRSFIINFLFDNQFLFKVRKPLPLHKIDGFVILIKKTPPINEKFKWKAVLIETTSFLAELFSLFERSQILIFDVFTLC